MKPDDIPQWAWDEASKVAEYINDTTVLHSLVMNAAARAIFQTRSQAFEESAKIAEARIKLFTSYGSGLTGRNALKEAANSIRSQAIRQHSQKGRDT